MLAFLQARWGEATSIWAKAGLTAIALAWATGQMSTVQALAAAAGAVVLYLHPEAKPVLGEVAGALAQAAKGALAGLALLAGLGLASCSSTSSTTPPPTPIAAPPALGPAAQAIKTSWTDGCAAYNLGGALVIDLVKAAEPSASGPLTTAQADLTKFCAVPVPTDPTVLAQDGPAFLAAWAALEPLVEQALTKK